MSNLAGTTWLFKDNISLPITNRGCEVSSGSFFRSKTINGIEISVTTSSITYEYELNAGGSISRYATMVYSNGAWGDAAYKTITFTDDPTSYTPDKNTFMLWLNANATPIFELSGKTWILKDKISLAGDYDTDWIYAQGNTGTYDFIFTSNFNDVKKISVSTTSLQHTYYYYQEGHDRTESVYNGSDSTWSNISCKKMKFYYEPIYYYPDKFTFFKWFNDNATEEKDLLTKTSELMTVADAVRKKAGNNDFLSFPTGFVNTINNIVTPDPLLAGTLSLYSGNVQTIRPYAVYSHSTIKEVYCPECSTIGSHAFQTCPNLTSAIFDNCKEILSSAFCECLKLSDIYFPMCIIVSTGAFNGCISLTSAVFPECTTLNSNAFRFCTQLSMISFDKLTIVSDSAFWMCHSLSNIYMPNCTKIGSGAFRECPALTTISLYNCERVGSNAFYSCQKLQSVSMSKCTSVGAYAFSGCSSLSFIYMPALTTVGSSVFFNVGGLTSINLDNCSTIYQSAFANCVNLTTLSLPNLANLSAYVFRSCTKLVSLYLLGSSVATLWASTAFSSTPIGGYSTSAGQFGSVFVPSSLYNTYITATNWSLISSRIVSV